MFYEFLTNKNEKVSIKIEAILFITELKNNKACIFDIYGNEYITSIPYADIMEDISNLIKENGISFKNL